MKSAIFYRVVILSDEEDDDDDDGHPQVSHLNIENGEGVARSSLMGGYDVDEGDEDDDDDYSTEDEEEIQGQQEVRAQVNCLSSRKSLQTRLFLCSPSLSTLRIDMNIYFYP